MAIGTTEIDPAVCSLGREPEPSVAGTGSRVKHPDNSLYGLYQPDRRSSKSSLGPRVKTTQIFASAGTRHQGADDTEETGLGSWRGEDGSPRVSIWLRRIDEELGTPLRACSERDVG